MQKLMQKRLDDWEWADFEHIIALSFEENQTLEFK